MDQKAFQDYYPDKASHCYGCGRLNDHGLKIKSYWDGDESVCIFQPKDYEIGYPGIAYGGLMASIIDCHSIGTAMAAAVKAEGLGLEGDLKPDFVFVTGSLHVDYLVPAPVDKPMKLTSHVKEMKKSKIVISTVLSVNGVACAKGEVIAVRIPAAMLG